MSCFLRTLQIKTFVRILLFSILFGVLTAMVVILVSYSILFPLNLNPSIFQLISYSLPSASLIFFISTLTLGATKQKTVDPIPLRPVLLNRLLKYSDAQTVLSLSAQDHYVEVTTELGSELCLLRLSDAIEEMNLVQGFQIHRSHWVAKNAIEGLVKTHSTTQAKLINGKFFNISQSRLAEFKLFIA